MVPEYRTLSMPQMRVDHDVKGKNDDDNENKKEYKIWGPSVFNLF